MNKLLHMATRYDKILELILAYVIQMRYHR